MSGLFGGSKSQAKAPTRYNAIQLSRSAYGNCIPLLYGTNRLPMTTLDYQDFTSTANHQTQGGKGGGGSSSTTSYTYTASILGAICEGPAGILTVFVNSSPTTLAQQNMTVFVGTSGQAPWTYMTQHHPSNALGYDHTMYVAAANYTLGSSAGLPNITYEVAGLTLWNGGPDAHPAFILPDYCTDPNHGCGFPFLDSFLNRSGWQDYCTANNLLVSAAETSQRPAVDFINEMLKVTNSTAVWSPGIGLRIVPYGDAVVVGGGVTFTPNLTPQFTFTDRDFIYKKGTAPVQRSITPANQTFNVWRVEFLDRSNQYNTAIEEYRDELDIATNGLRVAATVALHSICVRAVAKLVAAMLCNRNLYIRSTFTFVVRSDYSQLEPMDLVALNDSIGGITNQLVRIISVTDDPKTDELTITAEEMNVGPAQPPVYNFQLAQAYAANYEAAPGPVATPMIFTAPPALVGPTGGYEVWLAVTGTTGMWGGCDVYASLDNITYQHVGLITSGARVGVLTGPLNNSNTDPDTANTLNIQLDTAVTQALTSGTRADADQMRNLLAIQDLGGETEVVSFQTALPLGNNSYAISYLRRGAFKTPPSTHLAGAQVCSIDASLFRLPIDQGYGGLPIYFKFTSFNIFGGGREALSNAVVYTGNIDSQDGGQLLAPGAVALISTEGGFAHIVGNRAYKSQNSSAAWDSQILSVDSFVGGCDLKFTPLQMDGTVLVGLTNTPSVVAPSGVAYGWQINADGNAYIYEGGVLVATTRPYSPSQDVFELKYDGKYVTYYITGVQWRRVQVTPGLVLEFEALFYTPGVAIDGIYFGPLNPANSSPWLSSGSAVVSNNHVTKTANTSAWDCTVYSLEGFPTAHFFFKPNDNTTSLFMAGLCTHPVSATFQNAEMNASSAYQSIDLAWYCAAGTGGAPGRLFIYINGVPYHDYGTGQYDSTTVLGVTFDGTTARFIKNGSVIQTWTPTNPPPYFAKVALFSPAAGVNSMEFGPTVTQQLTDTSGLGSNAATLVAAASASGYVAAFATIPASSTSYAGGAVGVLVNTPPKYPCTAAVTITMQMAQTSGTTAQLAVGCAYAEGVGTGGTVTTNSAFTYPLQLDSSTNPRQTVLRFFFNHTGALPGGANAETYIVNSGGTSVQVASGNMIVQIEYILR